VNVGPIEPIEPIVVPWASQYLASGMQDGPDAVLDAMGAPAAVRVGVATLETALAGTADAVAAAVELPFALLGECTLAPGFLAGALRRHPDACFVWVDAHGDLNTPATSQSGFIGGMPFAVIVGWWGEEQRAACGLAPVDEARVALVGARDLDPGEASMLDASQIVSADGIARALAGLPSDLPIVMHVDGDVLDPAVAPGVDVPASGGWDVARLRDEMSAIAATGRLVALSLCCGNPHRDIDGLSTRAYLAGLEPLLA
jgi:arginase family enzyme